MVSEIHVFCMHFGMQIQHFCDFYEISRIRPRLDIREVQIQEEVYRQEAKFPGFLTVEESASEEITIKSYGPFEMRHRATGVQIYILL